jgi:CBS domain-containing protein
MSEDVRHLDEWGMGPVHGATSEGRGWWQGHPLTAADVMTTRVVMAPRQMPVPQIADLMRRESIGAVPIVDASDALVGLVTDRDVVVRGCASSQPLEQQTAADVMTTDLECAHADDTLVRLVERMARRGVRRLPVLDAHHRRGAHVVGMVSFEEVATHALDDPELAEALERLAHRRREPARTLRGRPWFLPALWRRLRG